MTLPLAVLEETTQPAGQGRPARGIRGCATVVAVLAFAVHWHQARAQPSADSAPAVAAPALAASAPAASAPAPPAPAPPMSAACVSSAQLQSPEFALKSPPALRFATDDASPMTFKAVGTIWVRPLTIEGASSGTPGDLMVFPTVLTADDADPLPLKFGWQGVQGCEALRVSNVRFPVTISATTTDIRATTYSGLLRLQFPDATYVAKGIKLAREPKDYKVSSALAISDEGLLQNPRARQRLQIGIEAPPNEEIQVFADLFQFKKLNGSDPASSEDIGGLELFDGIKPLGADEPFVVPKGKTRRLTVAIPGALEPGRYQAEMKLASTDRPTKDYVFDISVRRWWFWALACVILGVCLSMAMKRWAKSTRPRLEIRLGIALLKQHLVLLNRAPLNRPEKTALEAIETSIDKVLRQTRWSDASTSDWQAMRTRLEAVRARIDAFSRLVLARALLKDAQWDEPTTEKASLQLDAFAEHLAFEDAPEAERLKSIKELIEKLTSRRDQLLEDALAGLDREARAQRDARDAVDAQSAAGGQAVEAIGNARTGIALGDFDRFERNFDRARLQVAYALAHQVIGAGATPVANGGVVATSAGPSPLAIGARAVAARALQEIDPASAMVLARVALHNLASAQGRPLAASGINAGTVVHGSVPAGHANTTTGTQVVPLDALPTRTFASMSPDVQLPPAGLLDLPLPNDNARTLWMRIRAGDYVVDALTVVVAAVIGMYTIWVPNPIWGTPLDFIAAFFWGLGLGEVGKVTFSGINSLRTSILE